MKVPVYVRLEEEEFFFGHADHSEVPSLHRLFHEKRFVDPEGNEWHEPADAYFAERQEAVVFYLDCTFEESSLPDDER